MEKQKNSLKNGLNPLRRNCIDTKQELVAISRKKDDPMDKQKKGEKYYNKIVVHLLYGVIIVVKVSHEWLIIFVTCVGIDKICTGVLLRTDSKIKLTLSRGRMGDGGGHNQNKPS